MGNSEVKRLLLLLLISVAFGADKAKQTSPPTADTDLKLREIYNEHANASERGGQKLSALAERNCANLHATAAELILANPAKARAISKSARESCDDLLKNARDKEQTLAEDRLRASCKKLSDVGMEINGMVTRVLSVMAIFRQQSA
jgi:hypothetical protein